MNSDQIQALAHRLMQETTPQGILRLRRQMDDKTAQAVIRAVPPLERGALLLALSFRATDRWAPFDSAVIDGDAVSLEELFGDAGA